MPAVSDAFARDLFARLAARPGNLVVSPASVDSCLLLVLAGARGETAAQMTSALHLNGDSKSDAPLDLEALLDRAQGRGKPADGSKSAGNSLSVANSIWMQKGLPVEAAYRKLLQTGNRARFETADFAHQTEAARVAINHWVSGQTQGKIQELLAQNALDPSVRLVLVNAIYFKGVWEKPFPHQATRPAPFHRPGQPDVAVPTMYCHGDFRYLATDDYQAVEVPYANSDYAMVVLLPREMDGLSRLEKALSERGLQELDKLWLEDVELYLPKFKINSVYPELGATLAAMGMQDLFSERANLSGISADPLMLSKVVHQAVIEVDEKGTEAAAATAGIAVPTAAPFEPKPKPVFRADHPFLFALRHRQTGDLLFLGRVEMPQP